MLNRNLFFSPLITNKLRLLLPVVSRNFAVASVKKVKKDAKPKPEMSNEDRLALEQHSEGFSKLVEFLLKREKYSWQDYLQQIIVNHDVIYNY